MILTKKQLRRRMEQSAIPARLHSVAFAEITKHRRLMWETELFKADFRYRRGAGMFQTDSADLCADGESHNTDHAI